MSFPRYPRYKDSGVEWLGEVPEHWVVVRLRFLTDCLDGRRVPLNAAERSDRPGCVPYWGANSVVGYVDEALFDEDLVLLGEDGAPFFDQTKPVAFFIQGRVWPNNHVHVLRPRPLANGAFLTAALNATDYAEFVDGSTRDKLTQSAMNGIPLPCPPLPEQSAIAAFLDHETAKIDALVAEQRRLVELLKEKRQAVISHAVTKGLNPDAPMKDSGVEWLGEVPEHWEVSSLRHSLLSIFNGITAEQVDEDDSTLPVTRIETISRGLIDESRLGFVRAHDARADRRLLAGDVLLSNINSLSMIGNCAFYPGGREIYAGMNLLVLRPARERHPRWLFCLLRATRFRQELESHAKPAINQASVTQASICGIVVPVPAPEEQAAIAFHIGDEANRIDTLTAEAERAIALLQERRTALISAAVTGQIDVRDWAPEAA